MCSGRRVWGLEGVGFGGGGWGSGNGRLLAVKRCKPDTVQNLLYNGGGGAVQ